MMCARERRVLVACVLALGAALALMIPASGPWYELSLGVMLLFTIVNLGFRWWAWVWWNRKERSKVAEEGAADDMTRPVPIPPNLKASAAQTHQRLAPGRGGPSIPPNSL